MRHVCERIASVVRVAAPLGAALPAAPRAVQTPVFAGVDSNGCLPVRARGAGAAAGVDDLDAQMANLNM